MQRRLATHAHYAVRGTIPRKLIRQVATATYHHAWLPQFTIPVYSVDKSPVWDEQSQSYVDPKAKQPLPTWQQAKAGIGPDAEPAYVATMGTVDVRGIEAGTDHAERAIRYATKYITKDLVDQTMIKSQAQQAYFQRLHDELSLLPCSPGCANWLLYGVQPAHAAPTPFGGRRYRRRLICGGQRRTNAAREQSVSNVARNGTAPVRRTGADLRHIACPARGVDWRCLARPKGLEPLTF
jgi:hypothetical protein